MADIHGRVFWVLHYKKLTRMLFHPIEYSSIEINGPRSDIVSNCRFCELAKSSTRIIFSILGFDMNIWYKSSLCTIVLHVHFISFVTLEKIYNVLLSEFHSKVLLSWSFRILKEKKKNRHFYITLINLTKCHKTPISGFYLWTLHYAPSRGAHVYIHLVVSIKIILHASFFMLTCTETELVDIKFQAYWACTISAIGFMSISYLDIPGFISTAKIFLTPFIWHMRKITKIDMCFWKPFSCSLELIVMKYCIIIKHT